MAQKTMRFANSSTKYITNKQTASFHSSPFSPRQESFSQTLRRWHARSYVPSCVWSLLYFLLILISAQKNFPVRASREFFRELKGTRHVFRPSRRLTFVSSACLSCPAGVYLHVGINANSIARNNECTREKRRALNKKSRVPVFRYCRFSSAQSRLFPLSLIWRPTWLIMHILYGARITRNSLARFQRITDRNICIRYVLMLMMFNPCKFYFSNSAYLSNEKRCI